MGGRMTGADRTPIPVVRGPGKDNEARFSPDGRFIAHQSDDSGDVVMRFQPDADPVFCFRWRSRRASMAEDGGGELYYISKRTCADGGVARNSTE